MELGRYATLDFGAKVMDDYEKYKKQQRALRLASMDPSDNARMAEVRQERMAWRESLEGQSWLEQLREFRSELNRLQQKDNRLRSEESLAELEAYRKVVKKARNAYAESRRGHRDPRMRKQLPGLPDIDGETAASRQKAARHAKRLAALPADRTCPMCLNVILESRSWVVKDVVCCRTCYWELFNG